MKAGGEGAAGRPAVREAVGDCEPARAGGDGRGRRGMKVLHMISSGGMYGAEAVILNLARTLQDGPHRVRAGRVLNSSNPNLQLHESALEGRLRVAPDSMQGAGRPGGDCAAFGSWRTRTGADVVHAHGYKADIYAYLALRGMGVPLVSTCHTWYDTDLVGVDCMGRWTGLCCGGMRGWWRCRMR